MPHNVTMTARTIDGTQVAVDVRDAVRTDVAAFVAAGNRAPGIAVVLVGDDPASRIYTRTKLRRAAEAGIRSSEHLLDAATTERTLLALIERLNADDDVDGILVQLPLPAHVDVASVIHAIDPRKDIDGFHPENVGALGIGRPTLVPCTPLACVRLARVALPTLRGCDVTVVGRSTIVGRPVAQLFLIEDATVTIAHSATRDLAATCRRADVLVVAIGRPEFVTAEYVKPGAVVIDVGINRLPSDDGKGRIVGDVDFDSVATVAGAITPVPGGVGPMTVALLLENTLRCARTRRSLSHATS